MDEMTTEVAAAANGAAEHVSQGAEITQRFLGEVDKSREWIARMQDWLVDNAADFLVNLISVAIILLVGRMVIGVLCGSLHQALKKSPRVEGILEDFVTSIVRKVLWVMVLMMALKRLGVDIAPMIAGLGVMGFVVGFAFQESLGNLAAGVMLALNRPFKIGDFVDIAGNTGAVKAMDMMATTLSTPDNKKVVVPNKSVWGAAITNFTALDTRRVDMVVGVSYGTDLGKTKKIIREVLGGMERVLAEPPPVVEVLAMADSSVNLAVRPWVKTEDYWAVYFAANQKIKEAFDAAGIEIPFPQMDVHHYGLDKFPGGR